MSFQQKLFAKISSEKNGRMHEYSFMEYFLKILIIVYDYREESLSASYRVRKFAKFMSAAGHEVVIICSASEEGPSGNETVVTIPFKSGISIFSRIYNRIIGWPDPSAVWVRKALRYLDDKDYLRGVDVIISSTPPHGVQKLGLSLSETYKIPLIVDFRDDFITNHRTNWYTPFHKMSAARLESALVAHAKLVVTNTLIVKDRFVLRYPYAADKIITLPNGFDVDDFMGQLDKEENERVGPNNIVYVGGDYAGFAPFFLSKIAFELQAKGVGDQWTIHTAGPGDWRESDRYMNWRHYGLLSQSQSTSLMRNADILLLLMPPGEREPSGTVPLKTYSYLRAYKAIAYFGETGSTTDLLSLFDGTCVYKREDINRFMNWLLVNGSEVRKSYGSRMAILENYNFEELSARLVELVSDIVAEENMNLSKVK